MKTTVIQITLIIIAAGYLALSFIEDNERKKLSPESVKTESVNTLATKDTNVYYMDKTAIFVNNDPGSNFLTLSNCEAILIRRSIVIRQLSDEAWSAIRVHYPIATNDVRFYTWEGDYFLTTANCEFARIGKSALIRNLNETEWELIRENYETETQTVSFYSGAK